MIENEDAIFVGRPSRYLILTEAVVMSILVIVIFVALFFLKKNIHIDVVQEFWYIIDYLFSSILGLFAIYKILKVTAMVYSVSYTLTKDILEVKTGLFNIRKDILHLYRIKDIAAYQPLSYRFYGIGDVILFSTDLSHPTTTLVAVRDFEALKDKISELTRRNRGNAVLETI